MRLLPGGIVRAGVLLLAFAGGTRRATAQQAGARPGGTGAAPLAADTVPLDCTSCHPNVHATMLAGGAASERCATCHHTAHAAVRALYEGRASAPPVAADSMAVARVACRACHTDTTRAAPAGPARQAAFVAACMSCHGPSFGRMLPRWTASLARRTRSVRAYLADAGADRRLGGRAGARSDLAAAQAALALIDSGGGVHNVRGADALLHRALDRVAAAYRSAGLAVPVPPALGPDPATVACASCHYGIETASGTVFGQSFRHADHVVRAGVGCTTCHSGATYFAADGRQLDPRHGRTTVTAEQCSTCHHVTSGVACTACHAPEALDSVRPAVSLPLHLRPATAPPSRTVAFRHDVHTGVTCTQCHTKPGAIATVAACDGCHETHHERASDCTACHGTGVQRAHTAADHLACAACHARETLALAPGNRAFCTTCHVDRRNHQPGRACAGCHLQMTPAEVRERILTGGR